MVFKSQGMYQDEINPTITLLDKVNTNYLGKREQEDQELLIRETDENVNPAGFNRNDNGMHAELGKNKSQFKKMLTDMALQTSSINNQQTSTYVYPNSENSYQYSKENVF